TTEAEGSSSFNADIHRTAIIYSTLDNLDLGQNVLDVNLSKDILQVSPNKNLTVFALNLTMKTNIAIPGGIISIFCKKLTVPASLDLTIDASSVLEEKFKSANPFLVDFPNAVLNNNHDGSAGISGD